MKKQICAHQLHSRNSNWLLRIVGAFLLYSGLFFGPGESLQHTPLAKQIRTLYPDWSFVVNDILLAVFGIAGLVLITYTSLYYTKRKHGPKRMIQKLRVLDVRLIRTLLNLLSFITRWCIAISISVLVLLTLSIFVYVPLYMIQPVLYILAVFGLACIIESIPFWQRGLNKLFCIRTTL